jgi:hypothetical protein
LPSLPISPKLVLQLRFLAPQRPVFAIEPAEGTLSAGSTRG